jgi:hypothetical protein
MKASEITQPGLYWALSDSYEPKAQVVDCSGTEGRLTLEWLGTDQRDDLWDIAPTWLQEYDFIGPVPAPGEGPKFDGFVAALEALCRAWGVTLATSGYDGLDVWDADQGRDEPLHCAGLMDRTKPAEDAGHG